MNYSNLTKEEIIEVVSKGGFNGLPKKWKDDKEVAIVAVRVWSGSLEHVSKRLRDDKEVVLETVKKNGLALQYASERLQNDKNILEILEKLEKLEKLDISHWHVDNQKWYSDRMEVLANIREKELMQSSITPTTKESQKIKF